MTRRLVQEKFQVYYQDPRTEEKFESWVPDMNARGKKGMPGREGHPGGDVNSRYANNAVMFNTLPPGMDIEDQEVNDIRRMDINTSGSRPGGDQTQVLSAAALRQGFAKRAMSPTEEEYTHSHQDTFYDDWGGFVERGNVLDRM